MTDPEIAALRFEVKNLENQLNAYDNEKTELEKWLSEFNHRHYLELGDIIIEILRLRKLKFKEDKVQFEEAEKDETQYKEHIEAEKEKQQFELTEEEQAELKRNSEKPALSAIPTK